MSEAEFSEHDSYASSNKQKSKRSASSSSSDNAEQAEQEFEAEKKKAFIRQHTIKADQTE